MKYSEAVDVVGGSRGNAEELVGKLIAPLALPGAVANLHAAHAPCILMLHMAYNK